MADSPDAIVFRRRARRRLVGAIALVVFVVVVLPLVLDQDQRPTTQTLTVQIPSQNTGPFKTPVAPPPTAQAVPPTKSEPAPALEERPKAGKPDSRPTTPAARTSSATRDGAKPATKETPKTQLAEARRAQALLNDTAYYVPLGAFANPDNARQVQDKATAAGIGSYTEKLKGAQGEQTRVRAGPFASKETAEKAREALRSAGLAVGQVAKR